MNDSSAKLHKLETMKKLGQEQYWNYLKHNTYSVGTK